MATGFADDSWFNSGAWQRLISDANSFARSPAFDVFKNAAQVKLASDHVVQLNKIVSAQVKLTSDQVASLNKALGGQIVLPPSRVADLKQIFAGIQPVVISPAVQRLLDSTNRAAITSPAFESIRKSMLEVSKLIPSYATLAKGAPVYQDTIFKLTQSISTVIENYQDDLAGLAEDAAIELDSEMLVAEEQQQFTDLQAWLVVRVWAACVLWGWAVDAKLRGVADNEREKRGEVYADVRNKVIAGVIVALLGYLAKLGWDAATSLTIDR